MFYRQYDSYQRRHKLSDESALRFVQDKKKDLNLVEHIGLETILIDFIHDYECETFGGSDCNAELANYIRWNATSVDLLDGVTDTYVFDHYAIGELWMTNNGNVVLTAFDLGTADVDDGDDVDFYQLTLDSDIVSSCETVFFLLT